MPKATKQKFKLMYIMEILRRESDEFHPILTHDFLQKLEDRGVSCDRRTLALDIKDLNEDGYEIMCVMCGHEKGYYVEDRAFSGPEIRILMDAVQAAGFITENKTQQLVDKLATLASNNRAEVLKKNIVRFNTRKHTNETVYYSIDCIETAVDEHKKLSFLYFDLDENRSKVYRKERTRYLVDPVSTVFFSDRYYLLALNPESDGMRAYRVDRMEKTLVEEDAVNPKALEARKDIPEFTGSAIRMFNGRVTTVTLEFDESIMGAIYDHFGEEVSITRLDSNTCRVTVEIRVSPTFWGWLFQFADKMRLVGPYNMVEMMRSKVYMYLQSMNDHS